MQLQDIHAEIEFDLWVSPEHLGESSGEHAGSQLTKGLCTFSPKTGGQGYVVRNANTQWAVFLRDKHREKDVNFHLKRGCAHLAEIMQVTKGGEALLKLVFFNGDIVELGDIEVGIDERIVNTAQRHAFYGGSPDILCARLKDACSLHIGNMSYFIFTSGAAASEDFEPTEPESTGFQGKSPDEPAHNTEQEHVVAHEHRQFSIYGERLRIPVEKRALNKATDIYFATKAIFREHRQPEGALKLARGTITFSDYTKTGRISALAAASMRELTANAGSYLKQWDTYGAVEGDMLLSKARAVGLVRFNASTITVKGVEFTVPSVPSCLSEGDEMEVTTHIPLYLEQPEITWEEYCASLEESFTSQKDKKAQKGLEATGLCAKIISLSSTHIELNLPCASLSSEYRHLILSINGDKIQLARRMKARAAIVAGRSANPLLGLLIEEDAVLPSIQRVTKIKPLTPFVRKKIFEEHPPTDKQVEAIDIALNTPDMALIQGPPGTGKTTVITAILERLNEEYDKTCSIQGQVLVSGFQHDAVENIVSRLSINALPAVKFGKRSGESDFTQDVVSMKMSAWCDQVAEKIRAKNPQLAQTEQQKHLADLFRTYSARPSTHNAMAMIESILALPRDIITAQIAQEAEAIMDDVRGDTRAYDPLTIRRIYALRVTKTAFEDDGARQAMALLEHVQDSFGESEKTDEHLLEKAARWRTGKPLDFLTELKALKKALLYKYLPAPEFRIEKPRTDVLRLVAQVSPLLDKKLTATKKQDTLLAEFLHELENNPNAAREAIEEYNFVYAATTQQAMGKDILNSKQKKQHKQERNDRIKYDTVIIDEAARTSPRDMLIPMAQAEKRIILVGDHRQLPHLIDEEVARALEQGDAAQDAHVMNTDFVKKSMFEYLFKRLKKLEAQDGIKRTVTLDAQYRTHPLLGEFASQNFYAEYGEAYASPLSATHFDQQLPSIAHKAAIWCHVPHQHGKEERLPTGSRRRMAEAKVMAEYVNTWMHSPEGAHRSFGLISFYKAQTYAIYDALQAYGITERTQDGARRIHSQYALFDDGKERLRIGTVDAFQGMEFDIVLLSMVRSQNLADLPPSVAREQDKAKQHQRLFGHLMSENRLCVSMSRQKKALVVVGDSVFATSPLAAEAVPALKNFYELCQTQGEIL